MPAESLTQKPLTEVEVNQRRDLCAQAIKDRTEAKQKKKALVGELNEKIRDFDAQIEKLGFEIRERKSWVPAEPLFDSLPGGSTGNGEALPGSEFFPAGFGNVDHDDDSDESEDDDQIVEPREHKPGKKAGKKTAKKKRTAKR